jgi:thioredoxin 1
MQGYIQSDDENTGAQDTVDELDTVSSGTFNAEVLEAPGPIAVEFMSYGCSFCREMEPVIQQVAEMVRSKERIVRINVGQDQDLADTYSVRSTPSFLMFLDGRLVGRIEGPSPTVASVLTAVTHPFNA